MFIIIDGIDGSGKSTVMKVWADFFVDQGKKVYDLKKFWQENHTHPTLDELRDYDVIVSAEPTTVWTGAAVRQEMINTDNDYTPTSIAQGFALDRLVLYKRLILPLRKSGKIILQDRSVSSSLCYQPIQTGLSIEEIANIEGNKFCLENPGDHLIIADLPAEEAMKRLQNRSEKQDEAVFEQLDLLKKVREKYLDPNYQKYFTERGTKVHILNCSKKIDIMKQTGIKLLKKII